MILNLTILKRSFTRDGVESLSRLLVDLSQIFS